MKSQFATIGFFFPAFCSLSAAVPPVLPIVSSDELAAAGNFEGNLLATTSFPDGSLTTPFAGNYWVVRYYVSAFANGIPRLFLFNILNGEFNPGNELLNADGSLSTLCLAFSNLAWRQAFPAASSPRSGRKTTRHACKQPIVP